MNNLKLNQKKKILITGGGTGGHIYPGLAIAREILNQGEYSIKYIGSKCGMEAKIIPQNKIDFSSIFIKPLGRSPAKILMALFSLIIGNLQSFAIILKEKPSLVIGTGGYGSFPLVFMASLLNIKTIILEQNLYPGKCTKLLAKRVDWVALSFFESLKYLKKTNSAITGNPIRSVINFVDKETGRKNLKLDPIKPVILVVGASQGAKSINNAILKCLQDWKENQWQIIHITGISNFDEVKKEAENILGDKSKLNYQIYPYLDNIEDAYSSADLIISRAGATTISEITVKGIPAILVPYPYAAENHQEYNAKLLEEKEAAIMIKDKDLEKNLKKNIEELLKKPLLLEQMKYNSLKMGKPDAIFNIMKLIESELKNNN